MFLFLDILPLPFQLLLKNVFKEEKKRKEKKREEKRK